MIWLKYKIYIYLYHCYAEKSFWVIVINFLKSVSFILNKEIANFKTKRDKQINAHANKYAKCIGMIMAWRGLTVYFLVGCLAIPLIR